MKNVFKNYWIFLIGGSIMAYCVGGGSAAFAWFILCNVIYYGMYFIIEDATEKELKEKKELVKQKNKELAIIKDNIKKQREKESGGFVYLWLHDYDKYPEVQKYNKEIDELLNRIRYLKNKLNDK